MILDSPILNFYNLSLLRLHFLKISIVASNYLKALNFVFSGCVFGLYVHMCIGSGVHVCTCMWKSEIDDNCLPQLFYTLFRDS